MRNTVTQIPHRERVEECLSTILYEGLALVVFKRTLVIGAKFNERSKGNSRRHYENRQELHIESY